MTRITLYVLLPICVVAGLFLVWQGVPQTLGAYVECDDAGGRQSGAGARAGRIAEGDQLLSGDGGGFFNANSAHPFENPTASDRRGRDAADLPDRRGADQHVRPHGRRSASWLGFVRRHGGDVRGAALAVVYASEATHNTALSAVRDRSGGGRRGRPAATWKARRYASASGNLRCSPP